VESFNEQAFICNTSTKYVEMKKCSQTFCKKKLINSVIYKNNIKGREKSWEGWEGGRIEGSVLDKIKYENLYFSQIRHGIY